MPERRKLYFGDCLEILREYIEDSSVDLIYADPPFNSKRIYNAYIGGAQWVTFNDTWQWSEAVDDFHEVAQDVRLGSMMEGLRKILGEGSSLAYLSYMANRLRECRRVLKSTGSIYLHCDPTMSHYLKILMDGIFGKRQFRNELIWKRYAVHSLSRNGFDTVSDILLFYNYKESTFNSISSPLNETDLDKKFPRIEKETGRRFQHGALEQSSNRSSAGEVRIIEGREVISQLGWRWSQETFDQRIRDNPYLIYWTKTHRPRYKIYADEYDGEPVGNIWTDIPYLSSGERTGYATQKPLALLYRIIEASSRPGDMVLDPFCGCGTALYAAQVLKRQWIGIDVCVTACKVIENRFRASFDHNWSDIDFIGMPKTLDDAKFLAKLDKFLFERWAASLVDGIEANKKQRKDEGIDGRGRIPIRKGKFIDIVSQIKGGSTGPGDVQAFNGARQQAKADLGIFTCFEDRVTSRMKDAAVSAGYFMETPIIQIYTIEDYFTGRKPSIPRVVVLS